MKLRKYYQIIFWILLMVFISKLQGDEWLFGYQTSEHEFGDTKIIQNVGDSKSRGCPVFTFYIYYKGKLMAKYKNIYCMKIFASTDKKYFLGVSNHGVPGTAFVIFDFQGNLIREEKHDFFDLPYYCSESIIISRVWYNAENPNPKFVFENGRLEKVLINGCKAEKYNLLNRIVIHRGENTKKPIKQDTK